MGNAKHTKIIMNGCRVTKIVGVAGKLLMEPEAEKVMWKRPVRSKKNHIRYAAMLSGGDSTATSIQ